MALALNNLQRLIWNQTKPNQEIEIQPYEQMVYVQNRILHWDFEV